MKYEYKVIRKQARVLQEKSLNEAGQDRWELVSHHAGSGSFGDMEHVLIFKRVIK